MTDKEKFLSKAREYIGKNGYYVCEIKLKRKTEHWCADAVSVIYDDCGYIGKYIKEKECGAGSIPRGSDGIYGTWFRKSVNMPPQAGDLFFMRYNDYPGEDKYFCDHVGIVEDFDGTTITTLEGNVDATDGSRWEYTSTFKRKYRLFDDWRVYAFYRPNWQAETKTTTTSTKKQVEIYQLNSSKIVDYPVIVTASDGLNIRQGASVKFDKLGEVPCGVLLRVTRWTSGGEYKWGLIEYDGVKGWIALDYTKKSSIEQLAKEVIQGKYGNGQERTDRLGTFYDEVQTRVNQIMP